MTFKLLKDRGIFKQLITSTSNGTYVDGVYIPGTSSTTYPEFEGDWEPVSEGQRVRILPEGLQSRDSISIMTGEDLVVASNLGGTNFTEGDVIFLEDPTLTPDSPPYDVFFKEPWLKNDGFKLLDGHNYYVCIRRELQ